MELELNQIVVLPREEVDTTLALASPLFLVESTNTAEARIQSVSTDNGNEHTVQKFAVESFVGLTISAGELALVSPTPANEQLGEFERLAVIQLLAAL